jgi:predicted O-linked N-acetylglucosamine transferase (SPINDLY family)
MTAASPLQHALDLHRRGEVAQAVELYRQIIAREPGNADAHYYLATALCQQGRIAEGAEQARQAIALDPPAARGHNLLGLVLLRLGRREEALASFDAAIARQADHAEAHGNRAGVLAELGRHDEALAAFDRTLALAPDSIPDWWSRGDFLQALGRHAEAIESYDRALALSPHQNGIHTARAAALAALQRFEDALAGYEAALAHEPRSLDALVGRGRMLQRLARHGEAIAAYDAALALAPDHIEARINRGVACGTVARHAEAVADFERVLARDPRQLGALVNCGNALINLQRFTEALARFDAALALRPDHIEALVCRGVALSALERWDEALASYGAALAQAPGHVRALVHQASALRRLERLEAAIAVYDKALALEPDHVEARWNRGVVLRQLGRMEAAAADFRRALALDPDHAEALGDLATCQRELCEWGEDAVDEADLIARVRAGRAIVPPLAFVGFATTPADQFECANNFSAREFTASPPPLHAGRVAAGGRIRLAYLSADFRRHVMASHMVELFELHDRRRFEVIAVSFGPDDGSDMRARIVKAVDRFCDVRDMPDRAVAELIRDLEVDIAIDLMGYTAGARPGILRLRGAPVQAGYLGFPGTMAVDFLDYFIADPVILPFDEQAFFSEKIVHLPDCYQVNDRRRAMPDAVTPRRALALPDDAFVFCSFNNSVKITPDVFDTWMRLLAAVSGSVLWLYAANETVKANLRRRAAARGIAPERIVFAERMGLEEHLGRHRAADLCLDTVPYNGHGTTSLALWAGLPVVTCVGPALAGRVGASLLRAVGLPELVASSLAEYEALALRLARDRGLLAGIREKLAANRLSAPLFDTDRFRRHIEAAYATMWERRQRGEPPAPFAVAARDDVTP